MDSSSPLTGICFWRYDRREGQTPRRVLSGILIEERMDDPLLTLTIDVSRWGRGIASRGRPLSDRSDPLVLTPEEVLYLILEHSLTAVAYSSPQQEHHSCHPFRLVTDEVRSDDPVSLNSSTWIAPRSEYSPERVGECTRSGEWITLSLMEFVRECCRIERFPERFAVLCILSSSDERWIVREGLPVGSDFLVYPFPGPEVHHAFATVRVLCDSSFRDIPSFHGGVKWSVEQSSLDQFILLDRASPSTRETWIFHVKEKDVLDRMTSILSHSTDEQGEVHMSLLESFVIALINEDLVHQFVWERSVCSPEMMELS